MVLNNDVAIETQGKVVENYGQIELNLKKLTLDKVNREIDSGKVPLLRTGCQSRSKVNLYRGLGKIETGQY